MPDLPDLSAPYLCRNRILTHRSTLDQEILAQGFFLEPFASHHDKEAGAFWPQPLITSVNDYSAGLDFLAISARIFSTNSSTVSVWVSLLP